MEAHMEFDIQDSLGKLRRASLKEPSRARIADPQELQQRAI